MALEFGRRLPGIPSKKVRRDVDSATFKLDLVGGATGGYEMTATVVFMDYNKQTVNYSFEINSATPATALTLLTGTILPLFGIQAAGGNLQGLQMLSYTLSIHQEIGFTDNIQPVYGNQREMFGVIQFPVDGEIVEHRFPNPDDSILDIADKRYLNPAATALAKYIALFTTLAPGNTLLLRGKQPGTPQKMFMRHTESRVQTESVKIG
jgi:hypothetical protein